MFPTTPIRRLLPLAFLFCLVLAPVRAGEAEDEFLWLEEVQGERALAWVEEKNTAIRAEFAGREEFKAIYDGVLELLDATDKLVRGTRHGDHVYNLWRDAANPRGLYRRAGIESFVRGKPEWEVLLDLDALARAEGKSWVFKGMNLREPDYRRGLLRISDGGSDAVHVREFDLESKAFVEPPKGFVLPEAKARINWIDDDTVYLATDFGEGTLTDSGYPRIAKIWKRGTAIADAKTIFEGPKESVAVGANRDRFGSDGIVDWVYHAKSFYESRSYVRDGEKLVPLDIPETAEIHTVFDGEIFFELHHDWKVDETEYRQGAVLSIPLADLKAGKRNFSLFFQPTDRMSLLSFSRTKSYLVAQVMEDVRDRLFRYHRQRGHWLRKEFEFEGDGTLRVSSLDPLHDSFFLTYTSFLQPTTLYHVDAASMGSTVVQQTPVRFDAEPFESSQHFATSRDGTKIPYFLVTPKALRRDGKNPTLLYGYGGFRNSMRPYYLAGVGRSWLRRGGVYVIANIRGGGEYGPRWHEAALKENRPRAFEDFEAVAEDLVAKKITSPAHLGIRGGSNGGLLVGAAFTRRPDLFGAVVCQVPLLDMKRFNKLLAGASWMGEYGNPDVPEEWAYIGKYSPYHNLAKEKKYPRVLFTTSTKDDRVHPAHARKMVARMTAMGHPVFYYENTEGGHAGAADSKQRAFSEALIYTYLLGELTPKER